MGWPAVTGERRHALVTGGSRGLGAAIALRLARAGFAVSVTYRERRAEAEAVAAQVAREGGEAALLQLDLADLEAVRQLAERLASQEDPPSTVVNCAAELYRGALDATDPTDYLRSFTVNCAAAFALARGLAPAMRRSARLGPSVVNVSSVLGVSAGRDRTAYTSSKAALIGLTRALAVELAPEVRVNCVVPGLFRTEMNAPLESRPELLAETNRRIPLGRLGDPGELASVVAFLAGPEASYVTGAVWEVDGGVLARLPFPSADPAH
jgi:NAD(P)-dependent dehydrogenase (short-subunit alcohol dehydrogenase family)